MVRLWRSVCFVVVCLCLELVSGVPLDAAPKTWIGGNTEWVDGSGNNNWVPAGEPGPGDEAIFSTPNTVALGSANSIQALTMSAGISLSTNDSDLNVNGLIQLIGAGTDLTIGGNMSSVLVNDVTINAEGNVILRGGNMTVADEAGDGVFDINVDGALSGSGTVGLVDAVPVLTSLLINDGTIAASSTPLILGGAPAPGTLSITIGSPQGRIDLDGITGNGIVNVARNQTLDINGLLLDAFGGDINLSHNATLDISTTWMLSAGGTIDVDNGFSPGLPPFIPSVPADSSFISGGALTQSGGTITIVDSDGTLQFNAPFTMNGGILVNNGLVVFNANATISGGVANFSMPTNSSSITVNPAVTVNVLQPSFNADGNGQTSNVITLLTGSVLNLELGAAADDSLSGLLALQGGELNVATDDNNWSIDGTVNVAPNTGPSQINGERVTFSNVTVSVGANSLLDIGAPNVWDTGGNLVINAGATARLDGNVTFSDAGSFTGTGTLRTGGNVNFAAVTTINMPGGSVDLDGTDIVGNTVTVNANTTINAGTMASFGGATFLLTDTLVLNNFASLTVNVTDPNGEWTLTSDGVLDINAAGGMLGGGGIQGSDFNMQGTANVSGNSIWGARTDISGTVTVAALGSLNLRGGDLTADNVNRLEGGTITGDGFLRALTDEGLFGFGTIETDIEFATNTELRADNGILVIDAPILDMGVLGTADTDGILNRTSAWNTATNIDMVDMRGGEIRGGTITNNNATGINGFGLVSARVINNMSINARHEGTLVLDTPGNNNDWDGAASNGELNAISGNLELRDATTFFFNGTVNVSANRRVFANGFELEFDAPSTLNMTAGRFHSTAATDYLGTINVNAGADSTISNADSIRFWNTSNTALTGNLRVDSPTTTIDPGASFSGAGILINVPMRTLRLVDGITSADLAVLVQNEGTVQLGSAISSGQVQATDFQQAATGAMQIDLAGTGLNQFDRLNLTGAAAVDGAVNLVLLGGFVPALGNMFNVISASGGVTGTFDTVNQPASLLAAGLKFNVVYNPTLVQLVVGSALLGDYNQNGAVDAADYALWRDTLGSMVGPFSGADGDGDGVIDAGDYDVWRAHFGESVVTGLGAAAAFDGTVPEPGGTVPLIHAAMIAALCIRRSLRLPMRCAAGGGQ